MNLHTCHIIGSILSQSDLNNQKLTNSVEWLEVRADLVGDITSPRLSPGSKQRYIYSLRHRDCGGNFDGSQEFRNARLCHASYSYHLVELDFERDMDADTLNAIPPERRMIAWHGPMMGYDELRRMYGRMRCIPAAYYKLVPHAAKLEEGLAPLSLLRSTGRDDVIIYASGDAGSWTRLLAPYLGSPFVYGKLSENPEPTSRGAMNVDQLLRHYDFPHLRQVNTLFGVAATDAIASEMPMLHNIGYRELHLPALFLPFACHSRDLSWFEPFAEDVHSLLGFDLRGMSLGRPFKEAAIAKIGQRRSSVNAWMAKGASVMVRKTGQWYADTAEAESLVEAVAHHGIELRGLRAAVIGCGGAGRAAAVALTRLGAEVMLYNRSEIRGKWASALLNTPYTPLSQFDAGNYNVVVNATPLGEHDERLPISLKDFQGIVIDYAAHNKGATPLVEEARQKGIGVIDGKEILTAAVSHQFRLMTGRPLPLFAAETA